MKVFKWDRIDNWAILVYEFEILSCENKFIHMEKSMCNFKMLDWNTERLKLHVWCAMRLN